MTPLSKDEARLRGLEEDELLDIGLILLARLVAERAFRKGCPWL